MANLAIQVLQGFMLHQNKNKHKEVTSCMVSCCRLLFEVCFVSVCYLFMAMNDNKLVAVVRASDKSSTGFHVEQWKGARELLG
jgi:hypothetical protein